MARPPLLIERDGHVHRLTFNRPDKRNALDAALLTELSAALSDRAARAFVLSGSGGSFSAGYDIDEIRRAGLAAVQASLEKAVLAVETCHCPVIAILEGYCLGASVEILSAADIRIAGRGARIGVPSNRLALLYTPNGLARLHRALGDLWSRYLLLTGEMAGVEQLLGSFVHVVLPDDEVRPHGDEIARIIAEKCGPLSVTATRQALDALRQIQTRPGTSDTLSRLSELCAQSRDAEEALRAFADKRRPVFVGR